VLLELIIQFEGKLNVGSVQLDLLVQEVQQTLNSVREAISVLEEILLMI
jgi:hypothetical protein